MKCVVIQNYTAEVHSAGWMDGENIPLS